MIESKQKNIYIFVIATLVVGISILHYSTSTHHWQYHLIYMQAYFIPIILAAFQFGVRGGLGTALIVSVIYLPHIMMQWGGLVEDNLLRFLQIILFNVLGYLTGLKAQGEKREKEKYHQTAVELKNALEKEVKQSEDLAEMEQALRASDRLAIVGELTSSLAHEVRNPLGSIRGVVEIIREAVPDEVKKMDFFDILIQDTERLNRVVENYLHLAKHSSKEKIKFDMIHELRNIILMTGAQARKNSISMEANLPQDKISTIGNPDKFWQVLMNILLNAIQAIPGGGKIAIAARRKEESTLEISIRDSGSGINADKIDAIFKPFYTTKSGGTGLGLAIVKRICDENSWGIKIDSKPGEGTEVVLDVPMEKD